ncbi:hypothetical protein AX774_g3853 [Zancudomyces culisetae]|uniref:Uncharacterized protein n=1 Tax=Zancudomyces culisetae TaxID=1213189 RepID=A0A1R1PP35_ZANCU|nr:hypothetical protein AX774_g3853 [Zancudomyces culisetae]|eukprot:OMH82663.1 hypothetical protein AX774_g3853 [Zancudomyces culisetae]
METNRLTQVEAQPHNCGPDKYSININTENKNSNAETKMGYITNPTSPNADNYQPGMESEPTQNDKEKVNNIFQSNTNLDIH